jgi:hypothetical protein
MIPAHNGIAWAWNFYVAGSLYFIQVPEINNFLQLCIQYISTCVKG